MRWLPALSLACCAVAVACSDPARSASTVEPIPIPQFRADAAPAPATSPPAAPDPGACTENCSRGACDEGVCRRCMFAVDKRENPDGKVVARRYGIPILCSQMPPSAVVTVTASGDVSTADRCTTWRASLSVESRKRGRIGNLAIDARGEQVYPVHLEGVTATDEDGGLALVLQVGDVSSADPSRCVELRFHPGFTVTVAAQ